MSHLRWFLCLGGVAIACADPKGAQKAETGAETGAPSGEGLSFEAALENDDRGAFLSVWRAPGGPLWVVGGQPDRGVVLQAAGSADDFVELALPDGVPLLNWVHGSSPDDVWVGGLSGTLLHWDGGAWSDHSLGREEAVWGIAVKSPTEAWAVGGESAWGGELGFAARWDGASWTEAALPVELQGATNLFKACYQGDVLWVVGVNGVAMREAGSGLEAVATGIQADLVTVHAAGPEGPLVVVGGRGTGVVLEGEGSGLSAGTQAISGLAGVSVLADGRAVVVGEMGFTAVYDTVDNSLLETLPVTRDVLHGVWSAPGEPIVAVGGDLYSAEGTFHGSIWVAPELEAK
jgi:hypothetical protein